MKWIKVFQSSIITTIAICAIASAAEEKRPAALGAPAQVAEVNQAQFPYVGEITGTELNIRSGPGMNYYGCGKISSPAKVVVVGQKFSWSQILPPPGSFSWIFKQYVQTDVNNPGVGVVSGDNVRVYAGADDREPMVSDSVQLTVSKGLKVRIMGAAVGDYYKIVPPEGASLWTSSQYIKFLRKADGIDTKATKSGVGEANAPGAKPGIVMEQVDANSRQLEQYYTLVKQFDDEKKKPLTEQDYSKIRAGLEALAADANNGKAADYAKYILRDVARCELAKESVGVVEGQNTELQKQLAEIDKAHQEKVKSLTNNSKYVIVGIFKPSAVYANRPTKRFLITDANNLPICYAEPANTPNAPADANYAEFLGKQVGLVGEIIDDSLSSSALIKFSEIALYPNEAAAKETPKQESGPAKEEPNKPQDPNK
jgi:uncharacterized protein YgiM (DUF1202 family)